jgi:hypothetical protein
LLEAIFVATLLVARLRDFVSRTLVAVGWTMAGFIRKPEASQWTNRTVLEDIHILCFDVSQAVCELTELIPSSELDVGDGTEGFHTRYPWLPGQAQCFMQSAKDKLRAEIDRRKAASEQATGSASSGQQERSSPSQQPLRPHPPSTPATKRQRQLQENEPCKRLKGLWK